jgi:uncharacterized protein YukE
MARLGMDVDAVMSASKQLRTEAGNIDALVTKIQGIVNNLPSIWDGPDSQQFVNEWWPEHKRTLQAASSHITGLADSAKNNVEEQNRVSGRY